MVGGVFDHRIVSPVLYRSSHRFAHIILWWVEGIQTRTGKETTQKD